MEPALTHPQIEDLLIAHMARSGPQTYPEMLRFLSQYMEVKGDWVSHNPLLDNVIYWIGMSQEALQLMGRLFKGNRMHRVISCPEVYAAQGESLPLPLVHKPKPHKTPHWLPCQYVAGPSPVRDNFTDQDIEKLRAELAAARAARQRDPSSN